nr:hypothetical protein [uncultured Campylobacter sp.]
MEILLVLFVVGIFLYFWSKMPPMRRKPRQTNFDELALDMIKSVGVSNTDMTEVRKILMMINDGFDPISDRKGESRISGNQKLKILIEILKVKDLLGEDFAIKHLQYEINRFEQYGIRQDNKGLIKE